ncbi:MAG TPA: sulfatase [Rubrobacter sp.]|nr:sulfatase [Rubrobacter sp.]
MLRVVVLSLAMTLFLSVGCGVGDADKNAERSNASARSGEAARARSADDRPNIVFVMTDDMGEGMLSRMPTVRSRIVGGGIKFDNAFATQSLCCPARATVLRGQYPHNHRITANDVPDGGAVRFRRRELDESTFATWLQDSGYRTGLVGKYLNNTEKHYIPPGWDEWNGMIGMDHDHLVNENGHLRKYPRETLMTDVYTDKSLDFLRRATDDASDPPFMLWAGTYAPHLPADYSRRDADLFEDTPLPRPPSFNEDDVSDKPEWIRDTPRLKDREIEKLQEQHRDRLRSLQDVDRMVDDILTLLEDRGELDDTYVVFTTDNGLQTGQHRLTKKSTPYEEAAGVPLAVRGPGVPAGVVRDQLVINNDFAPTFADWADTGVPGFVDGRSLAPLLGQSPPPDSDWRTAVLNEQNQKQRFHIPDYEAVRTETSTYVRWKTGERELYDLRKDPYELENHSDRADPITLSRFKTLADLLSGCRGSSCRAAEGP